MKERDPGNEHDEDAYRHMRDPVRDGYWTSWGKARPRTTAGTVGVAICGQVILETRLADVADAIDCPDCRDAIATLRARVS